jgi:hypothetical protein
VSILSAAWKRNKHILKPLAIGIAAVATGGLAGGVIAGVGKVAGAIGGTKAQTATTQFLDAQVKGARDEAGQIIAGAGVALGGRVATPGSTVGQAGQLVENIAAGRPVAWGMTAPQLAAIAGLLLVIVLFLRKGGG